MDKENAMKDIKAIVTNIIAQSNQATQDARYHDNINRLKRLQEYIEKH
jgi:hypothetical protein